MPPTRWTQYTMDACLRRNLFSPSPKTEERGSKYVRRNLKKVRLFTRGNQWYLCRSPLSGVRSGAKVVYVSSGISYLYGTGGVPMAVGGCRLPRRELACDASARLVKFVDVSLIKRKSASETPLEVSSSVTAGVASSTPKHRNTKRRPRPTRPPARVIKCKINGGVELP